MRSFDPLLAAALAAAVLLDGAPAPAARPEAPGEGAPPPHKIAVDVRGPVALVQVTRVLPLPGGRRDGGEVVLDLALPERAALLDLELADGGRWRAAEVVEAGRAHELYADEAKDRGVEPISEPVDESAVYRVRVARAAPLGFGGGAAAAPNPGSVTLRYRFSALPDYTEGRHRLRFPGAPERVPVPADVTVAVTGAGDVEIGGARTTLGGGAGARGNAAGKVSTRSGWEVSWAPRAAAAGAAAAGGDGAPSLEGTLAVAPLSSGESALAFSVQEHAGRPAAPPPHVLFVVDRSRSVGLPGLSAERDLARRLLEALPPPTRFDAVFFDRVTKRLFPTERPATREAIADLENEMVPDRLQNGTDLQAALREAGALLRREATTFAPRVLVAVLTDGSLSDEDDGPALDRALGTVPGLELSVAAFTVRAPDDDALSPAARHALRALAGARGGVFRELRTNEVDEAAPAALTALAAGGDATDVRLTSGAQQRGLSEGLAPGQGASGVARLPGKAPRAATLEGVLRGQRARLALHPQTVDAKWLKPHLDGGAPARLLAAGPLVALAEPVLHPEPPREARVKGSMDRMVIRNTLSLAYTPRAHACYLNRTGATPALRDLEGRVRIAIDIVRGEVARARVESSTLNHPGIETCLREGAFAFEVPRAVHADAPVTAVLNLVFRPRMSDKKRDLDDGALSDQIDLIIEELHRSEQAATKTAAPPAPPTSN